MSGSTGSFEASAILRLHLAGRVDHSLLLCNQSNHGVIFSFACGILSQRELPFQQSGKLLLVSAKLNRLATDWLMLHTFHSRATLAGLYDPQCKIDAFLPDIGK